jgi:hypothetical protein
MSESSDLKKQVRLEPETYQLLCVIQRRCPWKVTLSTMVNNAILGYAHHLKQTFNPKPRK